MARAMPNIHTNAASWIPFWYLTTCCLKSTIKNENWTVPSVKISEVYPTIYLGSSLIRGETTIVESELIVAFGGCQ